MTNTIYLDEELRTPGIDHLDQYRNSCFYNLLNKNIKERGNAYEQIAVKILRSEGYEAHLASASYGSYDIIVDGKKIELKTSRKASRYDTRGRSYQFPFIRDNDGYDLLMFMVIRPCDTVEIYKTSFERIAQWLKPTDKLKSSYNLTTDPAWIDMDLVVRVQMK